MSHRLPAMIVVLILISLLTACGGGNWSSKVIGVFVSPGKATAYANGTPNQIVYKVEVEYGDNHRVALTSGVQWRVQAYWVSFDAATATATCTNPAPQQFINIPDPANITATATVEGQSYTDSAVLSCF